MRGRVFLQCTQCITDTSLAAQLANCLYTVFYLSLCAPFPRFVTSRLHEAARRPRRAASQHVRAALRRGSCALLLSLALPPAAEAADVLFRGLQRLLAHRHAAELLREHGGRDVGVDAPLVPSGSAGDSARDSPRVAALGTFSGERADGVLRYLRVAAASRSAASAGRPRTALGLGGCASERADQSGQRGELREQSSLRGTSPFCKSFSNV